MLFASPTLHVVGRAPTNGCHSVHVLRASCSCLPPLRETLQDQQQPDPGAYQITTSSLHSEVCEILYAPFESEVSIFPGPLGPSTVSPTDLQSQMLSGFFFLVQDTQAGEPDVGLIPVSP